MADYRIAKSGNTTDTWKQLDDDFTENPDILTYEVMVQEGNRKIGLQIDIDSTGIFDGWIESTLLTSRLLKKQDFQFSINDNTFNKLGAFIDFHYASLDQVDLDDYILINRDDKEKMRVIFGDAETKETFHSLHSYSFNIVKKKTGNGFYQDFFELKINEGIIDVSRLDYIFRAFCFILSLLD